MTIKNCWSHFGEIFFSWQHFQLFANVHATKLNGRIELNERSMTSSQQFISRRLCHFWFRAISASSRNCINHKLLYIGFLFCFIYSICRCMDKCILIKLSSSVVIIMICSFARLMVGKLKTHSNSTARSKFIAFKNPRQAACTAISHHSRYARLLDAAAWSQAAVGQMQAYPQVYHIHIIGKLFTLRAWRASNAAVLRWLCINSTANLIRKPRLIRNIIIIIIKISCCGLRFYAVLCLRL